MPYPPAPTCPAQPKPEIIQPSGVSTFISDLMQATEKVTCEIEILGFQFQMVFMSILYFPENNT